MIIAQDRARESASTRTKRLQAQRKERHDINAHPSQIQQGDIVYIHVPRLLDKSTCKKLQQVFMGPYIVCKFHSNCSVILQNLTTNKIVARAVHVDRLKKFQSVNLWEDSFKQGTTYPTNSGQGEKIHGLRLPRNH